MVDLRKGCKTELANTKILDLDWENPKLYAEWLAQTYYYAAITTRIIGLAGCHFQYEQDDLHNKFLDHAREERHHEKMLINDIKGLGFSLEQFKACSSSNILFQNQYYWIQNVNPIAVYGYFLYLEGLAVTAGPDIFARVKTAHPEKSTRYLKVHVEEDIGHVDGHYAFIDKLSQAEQNWIHQNLVQTSYLYRNMLYEVVKNTASHALKKVS